ncbi:MAG: hypothetical protein Q4A69_01145 [Moraxella sp.]|nr:hypothetical protein [Moraxella sp.]
MKYCGGVKNIDFDTMKDVLDDFMEFSITDKIANGASELYKISPKQSNKHNFDIFHYTVSKIYHLQLVTLDKDFNSYDELSNSLEFFKNLEQSERKPCQNVTTSNPS